MNKNLIKSTYWLMTNKIVIFIFGTIMLFVGIAVLYTLSEITENQIILDNSNDFLFLSILSICIGLSRLFSLIEPYRTKKLKKGFKEYGLNYDKETMIDIE